MGRSWICGGCGRDNGAAAVARPRDPARPDGGDGSEVPRILRAWGLGIAVLNSLGVLLGLVGLATGEPATGIVQLVTSVVFIRLGLALRRGERSAVYGLCILGGIAVLLGAGVIAMTLAGGGRGGIEIGVGILAITAVVYGPPIVVAFREWDKLH